MMEPIRVLHNIASLHFGGVQAFVMNIYNNIDRTKEYSSILLLHRRRRKVYIVRRSNWEDESTFALNIQE